MPRRVKRGLALRDAAPPPALAACSLPVRTPGPGAGRGGGCRAGLSPGRRVLGTRHSSGAAWVEEEDCVTGSP